MNGLTQSFGTPAATQEPTMSGKERNDLNIRVKTHGRASLLNFATEGS